MGSCWLGEVRRYFELSSKDAWILGCEVALLAWSRLPPGRGAVGDTEGQCERGGGEPGRGADSEWDPRGERSLSCPGAVVHAVTAPAGGAGRCSLPGVRPWVPSKRAGLQLDYSASQGGELPNAGRFGFD